jgi:multidrug resistance efflux pump
MKLSVGWISAGAAGMIVLCAFFWVTQRQVETVVAQGREIPRSIHARGLVVPAQGIARVRPRIDGTAIHIYANIGDRVQAGDLLAELDAPTLEFEKERLEAELNALSHSAATLAQRGRSVDIDVAAAEEEDARIAWQAAVDRRSRLESLRASGGIDDESIREAHFAENQAKAKFDAASARTRVTSARRGRDSEIRAAQERSHAADAALQAARMQADWERLVAPIDGVVLTRRIEIGDTILTRAGALEPALFEIADTSALEVRIEVNEIDAAMVEVGLEVSVHDDRDAEVGRGKISRVSPQIVPSEIDPSDKISNLIRAAWVAVTWDQSNGHGEPQVGRKFEVRVHLPPVRVSSALPRKAVSIENGQASVFIRRGFSWKRQVVELGVADDAYVEAIDLAAGAEVRLD